MRKFIIGILVLAISLITLVPVFASGEAVTRLKDIAKVQGVRNNQLIGYGLVAGLAGTGDSTKSIQTMQSIASMLKTFGVTVSASAIQSKNMAAVMLTAQLPPFVKPGDTIDVTISSMGDAKSLQGGTLLQTPLRAGNGQVYAVAQGPLSIGGFSSGSGGSGQQKNFLTTANLPNGAMVEREVPVQMDRNGDIRLALSQPDFTTAARISDAINARFGGIAVAKDAGTVQITVPYTYADNIVSFVAALEELPVVPDTAAKVVVNERTGTVVIGANVTIDEVAVTQGGLSIQIKKDTNVSQPPPLSNGTTAATTNTSVTVQEPPANLILLPATANVGDVVKALNSVGATPRDVISLLQAIKAAGALHADLQIM